MKQNYTQISFKLQVSYYTEMKTTAHLPRVRRKPVISCLHLHHYSFNKEVFIHITLKIMADITSSKVQRPSWAVTVAQGSTGVPHIYSHEQFILRSISVVWVNHTLITCTSMCTLYILFSHTT